MKAASEKLLANKEMYIGILKSIISDEDTLDLLIDVAVEVIIPMYKQGIINENVDEDKADALATKLKAINGKQAKTFVTFLLKALNIVDNKDLQDFANVCADYESEEGISEEDINTVYAIGDKYSPLLSELIKSLTTADKADIAAVGQVIGLDILNEINAFLMIYNAKNLATEDGQEAFFTAVQTWYGAIQETLYENVLFMLQSKTGPHIGPVGPEEEEEQPLSFGFQEEPIMGQTITADDIAIYFNSYNDYAYELNGYNVSEWNSRVQQAKDFLVEYAAMEPEEQEWNRYEYESSLEIATLEITNFRLSIDTSKCGKMPYTVSYTFLSKSYTYKGTADVSVEGLETIEKAGLSGTYGYADQEIFTSSGKYAAEIVYKDSDIKFTYEKRTLNEEYGWYDSEPVSVSVDTSKVGWHIFLQESGEYEGVYYCSVYYVVDRAKLNEYILSESSNTGYLIEGKTSFTNSAYYRVSYSVENGDIRWGMNKTLYSLSEEELKNKPLNQEITYVDEQGISYKYVIVSQSSLVGSYYSISVYTNDALFMSNWTNEMIEKYNSNNSGLNFYIYKYYVYSFKLDDTDHTFSFSEYVSGKPTNLNYQNGIFTFKVNDVNFSFIVNP